MKLGCPFKFFDLVCVTARETHPVQSNYLPSFPSFFKCHFSESLNWN